MKQTAVLLFLCFLAATPALAQDYRIGLFGGFSYVDDSTRDLKSPGWNFAYTQSLTDEVEIVGDFSGHYDTVPFFGVETDLRRYTIMTGLQFRVPTGSDAFRPFARALVGSIRESFDCFGITSSGECAYSDFAFGLGAGVDFFWSDHIGFRVIQADWTRQMAQGPDINNIRLSIGPVFRF